MSRHKFAETHGLWNKHRAEYRCWQDLLQRCNNPSNAAYASYGGRGIYVCDRWSESFEAFMKDMGSRPAGRSLDRINNDGPYSPENCRWATARQQCRNHRGCTFIEYNGCTRTIVEWSEITGIKPQTLFSRHAKGWSTEDIFRTEKTRPIKARKDSRSGLLGATKYRDKWRSQIRVNGNVKYLGLFESAQQAHDAYMNERAALKEKSS